MKRYGEIFRIKPEMKEAYKKDHDNIWPELVDAMGEAGFRNYTIFFRPDGLLFAYYEVDDPDGFEERLRKMSETEVSIRWEQMMEKYFVKESYTGLGPEIEELEEIFHAE